MNKGEFPDGALKHDQGKSPVVRGALHYFPRALMEVGVVSKVGAEKYAWDGWRFVDDAFERYLDALGRHLLLMSKESHDQETHMLHLAHVAWNALALLEMKLEKGKDIEQLL